MKPACKISKKRMRWARHWCLSSVWLKPAAAPRAKNLRFEAKPVADFTAVCRADRGLRKAERGSRRLTTGMAEDRKSLSKREQRFGLNSAKSNEEWKWMGLFKTKLAPPRYIDLTRWRQTLRRRPSLILWSGIRRCVYQGPRPAEPNLEQWIVGGWDFSKSRKVSRLSQ